VGRGIKRFRPPAVRDGLPGLRVAPGAEEIDSQIAVLEELGQVLARSGETKGVSTEIGLRLVS